MMRERVEDLGRILVMMQSVMESDLFSNDNTINPPRPKDAVDWFNCKSREEQENIIRSWAYNVDSVKMSLYDVLEIARGEDSVNLSD